MTTEWRRVALTEWAPSTLDAIALRLRPDGWVYVGIESNSGAALFVRYPP